MLPLIGNTGTDRCLLTPTTIPLFRTGRVDCQPEEGLNNAWETSEHEVHPNSNGNGVTTADFFKEHFNLTGREGAALLVGGHSFGKFNAVNSMFKYAWTRQQTDFLNNQMFRHLAMRPQYMMQYEVKKRQMYMIGDHLGQPAENRWLVRGNGITPSGGPFQWAHWYLRCPYTNTCAKMTPEKALFSRNSTTAYPDYPKAAYGPGKDRAEPATPARCCKGFKEGEGRCDPSCQRYIVNDETALSADTGYMFAFNVGK